jgi:polyisoprenyl-phosphate glycosyltransferase
VNQSVIPSTPIKPPLQQLSIAIPCYNEEEVLPETASRLSSLLSELTENNLIRETSIYFIDDGSTDRTWALIEDMAARDSRVHGIKLSRNYGHQSALLAGLMHAP